MTFFVLVEPNEALQFLSRFRRTIFHPGKTKCEEQKREARKAYEERCSVLGKRFCPNLKDWKEFSRWEVGGGYESKRDPLPTEKPAPTLKVVGTHRTPLQSVGTARTFRTPMSFQPTKPNFQWRNDEK